MTDSKSVDKKGRGVASTGIPKRDAESVMVSGYSIEAQLIGKSSAKSREIIRRSVSKHSAALIRLADR
ncbi:hypothetical protein LGT41_0005925 [Abyssibius alkaniclasticus]|uniref:hypothetical protein n=1 Tax=Abyssibius alkaniclasticus TaxID=2881234 RepID=UPI002363AACF|nr:hypothetical protein [Abyssibius alkaniclasticus]UPH72352.1 hypothetical protein LGT41_0005925 [Abyssibius alkaniclasticus]